MTHTKWTYDPDQDGRPIISNGKAIAYLEADVPDATGYCMAAASELLEALQELLADINDLASEYQICHEIMHSSYGTAAKAAIAKAKGETA